MPVNDGRQAGSGIVRWILVVSLGCSLGLLTVYILLQTRQYSGSRVAPTFSSALQHSGKDDQFTISAKPTGEELTHVVEIQLAAFRKDDYSSAYELAVDELKSQIPLQSFEKMVRIRYPAIAKSSAVKFGVIVDNGDEAIVNVTITAEDGHVTDFQYFLQRQKHGWRIGGVMELKPSANVI